MMARESVAVFWDYENLSPAGKCSGFDIVKNLTAIAHEYGDVKLLKAYEECHNHAGPHTQRLRSELQCAGVSLTDCPHNGRKEVADRMMTVDLLAFAIDNPAPATIVLITNDRDFVYAVSVLRLRRYRVILVAQPCGSASLKAQASMWLDWNLEVLEKRPESLTRGSGTCTDAILPVAAALPTPPPSPILPLHAAASCAVISGSAGKDIDGVMGSSFGLPLPSSNLSEVHVPAPCTASGSSLLHAQAFGSSDPIDAPLTVAASESGAAAPPCGPLVECPETSQSPNPAQIALEEQRGTPGGSVRTMAQRVQQKFWAACRRITTFHLPNKRNKTGKQPPKVVPFSESTTEGILAIPASATVVVDEPFNALQASDTSITTQLSYPTEDATCTPTLLPSTSSTSAVDHSADTLVTISTQSPCPMEHATCILPAVLPITSTSTSTTSPSADVFTSPQDAAQVPCEASEHPVTLHPGLSSELHADTSAESSSSSKCSKSQTSQASPGVKEEASLISPAASIVVLPSSLASRERPPPSPPAARQVVAHPVIVPAVPIRFKLFVEVLQKERRQGYLRISTVRAARAFDSADTKAYQKAGIEGNKKFRTLTRLAVAAGVITCIAENGTSVIALADPYIGI